MRSATRSAVGAGMASTSAPSATKTTASAQAAARVVRDHHDRVAERVDRVAQESEDVACAAGVERSGGLVGEHDGGVRDQGTGDRDALLLSAGELGRAVPGARPSPTSRMI